MRQNIAQMVQHVRANTDFVIQPALNELGRNQVGDTRITDDLHATQPKTLQLAAAFSPSNPREEERKIETLHKSPVHRKFGQIRTTRSYDSHRLFFRDHQTISLRTDLITSSIMHS